MPDPRGSRQSDAVSDCLLLCCTDGRVPIPQECGGGFLQKGQFCFLFLPDEGGNDFSRAFTPSEGGHLFCLPSDSLPQKMHLCAGSCCAGQLNETLLACLEGMRSLATMQSPARELLMRVMISEFVAAVSAVTDREKDPSPLGMQVMNYIDAHPAQTLSLDALAKRFFVSKFYLCRSFRAYAGESLHGYRTRRRVEAACRLMAAGDTAAAAAWKTGFSDYSTFYRACRKLYGAAPSRLPERHGNATDRTNTKGRSAR